MLSYTLGVWPSWSTGGNMRSDPSLWPIVDSHPATESTADRRNQTAFWRRFDPQIFFFSLLESCTNGHFFPIYSTLTPSVNTYSNHTKRESYSRLLIDSVRPKPVDSRCSLFTPRILYESEQFWLPHYYYLRRRTRRCEHKWESGYLCPSYVWFQVLPIVSHQTEWKKS